VSEAVVKGREVTASLGCEFWIEDNDGANWDITYEVKVFNPSGTPLGTKTGWVYQKPALWSSYQVPVGDPPEGQYSCEITWWIYSYQLPTQTATFNLSYAVPTGENTSSLGWATYPGYRTAHMWNVELTGANFNGRIVQEEFGGSVDDSCWFPGSSIADME